MSPDEVLKRLAMMGVKSSRATLLRYKDAGLISKPEEGAGGRGVGRYTDYPSDAVYEYFASYHIIKTKHASFEQAATARQVVRAFRYAWVGFDIGFDWNSFDKFDKLVRAKHSEQYGKVISWNGCQWKEIADAETKNDSHGAEMFSIAVKVYQTPLAVEWWELFQVALGKIEKDYIDFCDRFDWEAHFTLRKDSWLIIEKIDRLYALFEEVVQDMAALQGLCDSSNIKAGERYAPLLQFGRWIALYKMYPELQLMIRNGMLQNFRNIRPATLDLLTTGKLPEV